MIPTVNLITDLALATFLAIVPLYVLDLKRRARLGFDVSLGQLLAAIMTVGWMVMAYGSFVEPQLLVVREHQVSIVKERTGAVESVTPVHMRIAVVSDFHLGLQKGEGWTDKVVRRVNDTKPDLVLLLGDFVSVPAGLESMAPLSRIQSRLGTYAVLGNWDYRVGAVDVRRKIESYGIEVLTNESVRVGDGDRLYLVGLDDLVYGNPDWDRALIDVPPEATVIAVGHEPDIAPAAEANGISLAVSGHTHGGQVRLPLIGAVPPLPTDLPRDFDMGLFPYGKSKLFITSGVGESGARARLFNPPQIDVLDVSY